MTQAPMRIASLVVLIWSGCAGVGCTRDRVEQSIGPAHPELRCSEVPNAELLVRRGAITALGELHGTSEVPAFVGDLVCMAAKSAPVTLGLEMDSTQDPVIEAFLASDGSDVARQALLAAAFSAPFPDGRSSVAMAGLLDRVRQLRAAGAKIEVFGFDGPWPSAELRDAGMGAIVVRKLGSADYADRVTFLLAGNLHAQTDSDRWMGWHVRQKFPGMRSLDIRYAGGEAWICEQTGCGPTAITGIDRGSARFIEWSKAPDERGFDGIYYLGHITASPPAVAFKAATEPK